MGIKDFKLSKYLPEIVYGGNDGIVTTFAVVSGFIGAGSETAAIGSGTVVLIFGLANLFADATSMGLGDFLSERSSHDNTIAETKRIESEIANQSDEIIKRTKVSLRGNGLSDDEADKTLEVFKKNNRFWKKYMLNIEYKLKDIEEENPAINALVTFFSFIVFGGIPLLPFIFLEPDVSTGIYSAIATFTALFLLGILRWQLAGRKPLRNILEIIVIGGIASSIAFAVGYLFRGV
jgi:VIT1/CCC1 family predicted Fe2+/Mn2+ transporter